MDVLSDVLRAVRLTGAVYFVIDASSPWVGESPSTAEIAAAVMPGAEHVVSFHAVMSGSCWASLGDGSGSPLRINEGDVVVFPGGAPNVLASSPELRGKPDMAMYYRPTDTHLPFSVIAGGGGAERTRLICGYFGCDARPYNPLLSALPALMCVRKPVGGGGWITDLLRLTLAEGGSKRAGTESILAKLSEAMFVDVIRRHIESLPDGTFDWLSGLRDSHVGKALRLIHARPAKPWSLEELAQEVGLSRTVFAARFADYVDVPPMQYVARWRLQLASRLLEQRGISVAQASAEVGYESEAAFNRAFKKYVGVPPGEWRRRRHAAPLPQSR
ncbi:MAG TPA: AraC family transcriptional regulator [Reyranella sp.]|nr:AraC family transcriptional regulator [Reyranella sp.]